MLHNAELTARPRGPAAILLRGLGSNLGGGPGLQVPSVGLVGGAEFGYKRLRECWAGNFCTLMKEDSFAVLMYLYVY